MTVDEILTATFAEYEYLAPDADAVLADLRQQLAGRRRRSGTRSLATLSAAAAVAVLAITLTLIHSSGTPAKNTTGSTAPAGPNSTTPPATATRSAYFTTIAAGWLPGPMSQVLQQSGFGSQFVRYDMTVDKVHTVVNIALQPGNTLPRPPAGARSIDTTINGHPGLGFALTPDRGYLIGFQTGDGHIATVSVLSNSTTIIAATATRVARTLQLDRHDPIPTDFKLTHLPAGLTVRGISHRTDSEAAGTTYWLADLHAASDAEAVTVSSDNVDHGKLTIGPSAAPGGPTRSAGRPVHGHTTVVQRNSGQGYDLEIGELHPGIRVVLATQPDIATLAGLYRIANGIRWNS